MKSVTERMSVDETPIQTLNAVSYTHLPITSMSRIYCMGSQTTRLAPTTGAITSLKDWMEWYKPATLTRWYLGTSRGMPVSYTHLETICQRRIQGSHRRKRKVECGLDGSQCLNIEVWRESEAGRVDSVSYTHLKRDEQTDELQYEVGRGILLNTYKNETKNTVKCEAQWQKDPNIA